MSLNAQDYFTTVKATMETFAKSAGKQMSLSRAFLAEGHKAIAKDLEQNSNDMKAAATQFAEASSTIATELGKKFADEYKKLVDAAKDVWPKV